MSNDAPLPPVRIGIVTVSDRASQGLYEDKGGPAIAEWLARAVTSPVTLLRNVIPDGAESVAKTLIQLIDMDGAELVLVTGGTGPSPRDETPEGVAKVISREYPGFGEEMRRASLQEVPTAILSRQTAGSRGTCLIITLPGKPSAIATCLNAVFAAVPYCLDLLGAGRIETNPAVIAAFRPKV
jgi:molybdopterin adenylyltransferase